MKITIGQLRRVIKEEVSRVLSEANAPQFPGVAGSWLGLMKRSASDQGLLQDLAGAWDAMSSAGAVAPVDVRSVSDKIAADFGLSPQAVSFHLRKNPGATGVSGQDLLDGILADRRQKQQDAERAKAELAKPGAVFDREITDITDMNYGRRRYATIQIQPDGSEKVIRTYIDKEGSLGGT